MQVEVAVAAVRLNMVDPMARLQATSNHSGDSLRCLFGDGGEGETGESELAHPRGWGLEADLGREMQGGESLSKRGCDFLFAFLKWVHGWSFVEAPSSI
jgi:hypothetical protein